MAKLNVKPKFTETTHEGAPAAQMNDMQALRRSVLSCLLWEDEFYEDGEEIAARITKLAMGADASQVAALAIEARETFNLRHIPLLLLSILARTGSGSALVSMTIGRVIQRADELAELLAVHAAREKVTPGKIKQKLSSQMRLGLAKAFAKFDEYQLAKYDRAGAIRLRDVLFLAHPKAASPEQDALWKRLVDNQLATPETWETQISAADKDKRKAIWTGLVEKAIAGEKGGFGYMGLLRNLRNMLGDEVDTALIKQGIVARKGAQRTLPFRYTAAARAAPQLEKEIDAALVASIKEMVPLPGVTAVLVDVSGSMDAKLSGKSDLTRVDAAATLASIIPSDDLRVFSFSDTLVEVPARKGMAGVDAILKSQIHNGTRLLEAVQWVNDKVPYERIIVISDEQAHVSALGRFPDPKGKGYMINVASHQNGVGYGAWTHIDGFSEAVLKFIAAHENALVERKMRMSDVAASTYGGPND